MVFYQVPHAAARDTTLLEFERLVILLLVEPAPEFRLCI